MKQLASETRKLDAAGTANLEELGMAGESLASTGTKSWLYHPVFSDHWERRALYSLAQWVNGLAFRDIQFSPTGKPVIKIAEIKGGISGQTKFTEQVFDESVHVRAGDLLFSWSGQPETSIDVFWWRGSDGWLNQHSFRVTPVEGVDPAFFFYLLRYLKPGFIGIARNKQTTGLGHVTKRDLENIEAAYPSLPEQHAIARILGTLDDKIDLNRRMNETLEATARAIFKSWFVDAIATGLPKGWREGSLGDVAENPRRGVQPHAIEPSTPYIGLEHMPRHCIALSEWGPAKELESNKFEFKLGEVLFGKLRPYFHKVGVAPLDGVCSTDILVITPTEPEWFGFMLGHVSSVDFVNHADGGSTGTKMPRTNWQDMARYEVALPPKSLASDFTEKIRPLVERIMKNIYESRTLAAMRDTLLPKLLSGEIRAGCSDR